MAASDVVVSAAIGTLQQTSMDLHISKKPRLATDAGTLRESKLAATASMVARGSLSLRTVSSSDYQTVFKSDSSAPGISPYQVKMKIKGELEAADQFIKDQMANTPASLTFDGVSVRDVKLVGLFVHFLSVEGTSLHKYPVALLCPDAETTSAVDLARLIGFELKKVGISERRKASAVICDQAPDARKTGAILAGEASAPTIKNVGQLVDDATRGSALAALSLRCMMHLCAKAGKRGIDAVNAAFRFVINAPPPKGPGDLRGDDDGPDETATETEPAGASAGVVPMKSRARMATLFGGQAARGDEGKVSLAGAMDLFTKHLRNNKSDKSAYKKSVKDNKERLGGTDKVKVKGPLKLTPYCNSRWFGHLATLKAFIENWPFLLEFYDSDRLPKHLSDAYRFMEITAPQLQAAYEIMSTVYKIMTRLEGDSQPNLHLVLSVISDLDSCLTLVEDKDGKNAGGIVIPIAGSVASKFMEGMSAELLAAPTSSDNGLAGTLLAALREQKRPQRGAPPPPPVYPIESFNPQYNHSDVKTQASVIALASILSLDPRQHLLGAYAIGANIDDPMKMVPSLIEFIRSALIFFAFGAETATNTTTATTTSRGASLQAGPRQRQTRGPLRRPRGARGRPLAAGRRSPERQCAGQSPWQRAGPWRTVRPGWRRGHLQKTCVASTLAQPRSRRCFPWRPKGT